MADLNEIKKQVAEFLKKLEAAKPIPKFVQAAAPTIETPEFKPSKKLEPTEIDSKGTPSAKVPVVTKDKDFLAELTKIVTLMAEMWEGPVPVEIFLVKKDGNWIECSEELHKVIEKVNQEATGLLKSSADIGEQIEAVKMALQADKTKTIQIDLGPNAVHVIKDLVDILSLPKKKSKKKKSKKAK